MNIVIYPPESSIAFNIFGFPIYYYGIIISLAMFLGLFSAYYTIKKTLSKKQAELFLDFSPMVIIYSILGARLFYIIGNFSFYFNNPKEIIMLNHGGLSVWGGIIFGIGALYLYSKHLKFDLLKILDIFALFMPLSQAIGRWGNYFNQEAYGKPTQSAIKLYVTEAHRYKNLKDIEFYHPTFLYEMVLNLILFFILILIYKKHPKKGVICCLYLIFYGLIRIIIENIRIDSVCYVFNLPVAILISSFAVIAGFIFLMINLKKDNETML